MTFNPAAFSNKLDFSGLDNSIGRFHQEMERQRKLGIAQNAGERLAVKDYGGAQAILARSGDIEGATRLSQVEQQRQMAELQRQEAKERFERTLAGKFAGIGQMWQKEPDEGKRLTDFDRFVATDPRIAEQIAAHLPPELHRDPVAVWRYFEGIARGYVDPLTEEAKRAQIAAAQAGAVKDSVLITPPGSQATVINPKAGIGAVGHVVASSPAKMPPHYEADPGNPGGYRPIQGGAADVKFQDAKNQAATIMRGATGRIDDLIADITEIEKHPGTPKNFGAWGGTVMNWPGGEAANAWAKISQLKDRGAFATLQTMREMSKTGGALGQVSDAEGARLERAFAALQTARSPEAAVAELAKVKAQLARSRHALQEAFVRQYSGDRPPHAGMPPPGAGTAPPPAPGAKQAPDGNWYVPDPNRPGKYLRVDQ